MRIKSVRELHPHFRPRWVKIRFWALLTIVPAFLLVGIFAMAKGGPVVLLLICIVASALAHPRGTLAFFGLLTRNHPRFAGWQKNTETWLELDLDYEEARPK